VGVHATGVNPGRHGCFDLQHFDGELGKLRPLQAWDIAEKTSMKFSKNGAGR